MDAQEALAFLTEISSQIQAAVVFDEDGKTSGSTFGNGGEAEELARGAGELLDEAERLRGRDAPLTQLEIATDEGSVFVVRDGKLRIAATTTPRPTTGLVFYDLKSALREIDAKPRRPRQRKKPAAPKAAAAKPASPKAAAAKPASPKAAAEKPASPKPAAEKPASPKPAAPKTPRKKPAPRKEPDAS